MQLSELPPYVLEEKFRLTLSELAFFLRQPVKYFFQRRLSVSFNAQQTLAEDLEPFGLDGLETYALLDALLDDQAHQKARKTHRKFYVNVSPLWRVRGNYL